MTTVAVIGAASAKGQDYLAALSERKDAKVVAIVVNQNLPPKVERDWRVIKAGNIDELLATSDFDTAIVALPHHDHEWVTKKLLAAGKHVIKEKPLGMRLKQAQSYERPIFTTVQRTVHPLFEEARLDLGRLGKLTSFSYSYTFNLPSQTTGWRAEPAKSGGGVVLDMGYHALEVVIRLFGYPQSLAAEFGYKYPEMEQKRLEDKATINLSYEGFSGKVLLDRHHSSREELLTISGEKGKIILKPNSYELFIDDTQVKKLDCSLNKIEVIQRLLDVALRLKKEPSPLQKQFETNLETMRLIDAIYAMKKP
jgi:predicted dehydrogenase